MKKRLLLCFCLAILGLEPAWALRCGNQIVREGYRTYEVLERCGEPDYRDARVEYQSIRLRGSGVLQPGIDVERTVPINIEEWTYNFGPRRFMQWLRFENGRLVEIRSLRRYGD
jgi:hypothetical protein